MGNVCCKDNSNPRADIDFNDKSKTKQQLSQEVKDVFGKDEDKIVKIQANVKRHLQQKEYENMKNSQQ
jgi:hypothetical protein